MNVDRFRERPGDRAALKRHAPGHTGPFSSKDEAAEDLEKSISRLQTREQQLYAQGEFALAVIFQGMDTAGKDSAIKKVMAGVNPQTTDVHAVKQPSSEELSHDFLWRAAKVLPARGRIGIFNRSYYEEVLVVRVHPEFLSAQRLPEVRISKNIWEERFEDIKNFERHLWRSGTLVLKF